MMIDNSKTKAYWDTKSKNWYKTRNMESTINKIIENPSCAFPKKIFEIIQKYIPNLNGKKICVPSSGDNIVVFAFYLMGAKVTSVDISAQQIMNAQSIAEQYGWDIEFICDDSLELSSIESNEFDLVYTSNGVHVWISDLKKMYDNFNRVLNDKGYYILFETHPFIRPFDDSQEIITVKKAYEDIGPFGDVPNYHWRMQDFINNLITSGFNINNLEEFHPEVGDLENHCWWYSTLNEAQKDNNKKFDWKQNPWAALPQWLTVCVQKTK